METKIIEMEELQKTMPHGAHIIVHFRDSHYLGKYSEEIFSNAFDNLVEAWVFNETSEYHLFETNGKIKCIATEDGTDDDFILDRLILAPKHRSNGDFIIRKKYISYDEDGQAYESHRRLSGIGRFEDGQ
ncbi:MAG TPA: hypothetical protein P5315_11765 [Clostridia bacterium]|nr:hypothetical protein [Clostridia bacterium]